MITNRRGNEKSVKDTMFLFLEGYKTEFVYFKNMENIRSKLLGNSIHLELKPIRRDLSKLQESTSWKVYHFMRYYEDWVNSDGSKCQSDLFLTCFLYAASKQSQELHDKLYPPNRDNNGWYKFDSEYFDSRAERLKNILKNENLIFHEKKNDYVYVDRAYEVVKKEMEILYPKYTFDIDKEKYLRPIKPVGKDYYCMVIDRDQRSLSTKNLEKIKKECRRNGYELIITNPNFELWLALHTKDYNKDEMLEDITNLLRLYAKGKSSDEEKSLTGPMYYLKKRYPKYKKDPQLLDIFNEENLEEAIENLKKFHETNFEIVSNELTPENLLPVGSNILDLILR